MLSYYLTFFRLISSFSMHCKFIWTILRCISPFSRCISAFTSVFRLMTVYFVLSRYRTRSYIFLWLLWPCVKGELWTISLLFISLFAKISCQHECVPLVSQFTPTWMLEYRVIFSQDHWIRVKGKDTRYTISGRLPFGVFRIFHCEVYYL